LYELFRRVGEYKYAGIERRFSMEYAVIRERIRDYCRYHILPAEQYRQEREEGCWTHYSFETVKFFDSLEEAEKYVKDQTDYYVLFYCSKLGFQGYDICHYTEAQNVYTQPSIFDIIFEGSLEECQKLLKELESKEEVEA